MAMKVLDLFGEMSVKPDAVIIIILFNACAKLATDQAKNIGKKILQQQELSRMFLEDEKLVNSAIDMLMKFGDVTDAERLFQSTKKKTIVTYGAMMKGNSNESFQHQRYNFVLRICDE